MPSPGLTDAVGQVAGMPGMTVPIAAAVFARSGRGQNLTGARIDRVARIAGADGRPVVAARDVEQRRVGQRPLVREEIRHLQELIGTGAAGG